MTTEELHLHHMLRDQMTVVAGLSAATLAYDEGIAAQISLLKLAHGGATVSVNAVIAILKGLQGAAASASSIARQRKQEDFAQHPLKADGK